MVRCSRLQDVDPLKLFFVFKMAGICMLIKFKIELQIKNGQRQIEESSYLIRIGYACSAKGGCERGECEGGGCERGSCRIAWKLKVVK